MPVYQPQAPAAAPGLPMEKAQPLPAQAGYVSKGGAAAYVADGILQGWLKGREYRKQQELAKAQNQLSGADYTYQTMAQNYNNMLRMGKDDKDPEVQKAKAAASNAWQAKLNVMQQYAMPEEQKGGEKKGLKQKVEGGLGHFAGQMFGKAGIQPQMIPQASLAILRSSPPPGLGLTLEDKQAQAQVTASEAEAKRAAVDTKAAELKLQVETQKAGDDQKMQTIVKKQSAGTATPEEKEWLKGWQAIQHINDPESQKLADGILKKVEAGEKLSDTERNFAYAQRILDRPQTTFRTDANGMDQVITVGQDGKILSTMDMGRHYEPDQVGPARRIMEMQQRMMYDLYRKAGMSDADAWSTLALEQSKNAREVSWLVGNNPKLKEQQMTLVDKAIRAVMSESGGAGADPEKKKELLAQWSNFIVIPQDSANGLYVFRDQLAPAAVTKHWWGLAPNTQAYAGGVAPEQMASVQAAFYNRVRTELQKQNPNLNQMQLDSVMPEWLKKPGGAPTEQAGAPASKPKPQAGKPAGWHQMVPPPFSGALDVLSPGQQMSAPPQAAAGAPINQQAPGTMLFTIDTDQGPQQAWMTPQQAADAAAAGASVVAAGK